MEKILLYKNKSEIFNCQFKIEGVDANETQVRLCLEFDNNKNMFFYGTLDDSGNCEITIPALQEIKQDSGKLSIEAIADSTYFKVYEANVELKSSVEVQLLKAEHKNNGQSTLTKPKIKLERKIDKKVIKEEETKPRLNPYVPRKLV